MTKQIQGGSISNRLRSYFRLRGKTTFNLDEVVVPVVMAENVARPPYTGSESLAFYGTQQIAVSTATTLMRALIAIDATPAASTVGEGSAEDRQLAVIDDLVISLIDAPDPAAGSPAEIGRAHV